jgi:hypothetical protein
MVPMAAAFKTEQLLFLILGVLFSKPFNPTRCIHQFLFAGKKGMALRTNFHANVFFGGPHLNGITAGTLDGRWSILWMNIFFHYNFNPLYKLCIHGF